MEKERKITKIVKYAILGYIMYIAAYGCRSLYQSVREKAKSAVEWTLNTKDDISSCVDQTQDYLRGNEPAQRTIQPNQNSLETKVDE